MIEIVERGIVAYVTRDGHSIRRSTAEPKRVEFAVTSDRILTPEEEAWAATCIRRKVNWRESPDVKFRFARYAIVEEAIETPPEWKDPGRPGP